MAIEKATRKKMEDLIYSTFDALDETKTNSGKYRELFGKMSDLQFDAFFKKFFASEDEYLTLDVVDYERDLTIGNVEKAAKQLGVPLFEKVATPFVNKNPDNPIVTKYEVPVGYIHVKRMQQLLSKKNTTSTEVGSRSALTGQVVGRDKNARDSDSENFALVTLDANETLRELMGPRADDMVMKSEMYADISRKGFTSLNTLTSDVDNKATINAVDVHLIGMGIKSDLITDGLALKKTLNTK